MCIRDRDNVVCRYCDGEIAFWNLVDITNGSYDNLGNRIDGYITPVLLKEKICDKCGSVIERIYEIPKRK